MLEDSENQNEEGHVDPSVLGHTGNLTVTAPYVAHVFNDLLIKTTTQLTEEFPYKQDMNDGRPIGICKCSSCDRWELFHSNHLSPMR